MFTGIVEETGTVSLIQKNAASMVIGINCSFAKELALGESVAVNGVCLTVTQKTREGFTADVTPESFRRTALGDLKIGSTVNLERAMKADGRFGGHIVSGHIDGTGIIAGAVHEQNAVNVKIAADGSLGKYIIEKGSVCVDGISLTVAGVESSSGETIFEVAVIPHTWQNTTLSRKNSGSRVNIECDVVSKYIERFLNWNGGGRNAPASAETMDEETLNSFMSSFPSFH